MSTFNSSAGRPLFVLVSALMLFACGGGGGGGGAVDSGSGGPAEPPSPPTPPPPPPVEPLSETEAVRFLSQASFGPSPNAIADVVNSGMEDWFTAQLDEPATLHLPRVLASFPEGSETLDDIFAENGNLIPGLALAPAQSYWLAAIEGEDQLRQRMAFALSQILVVSGGGNIGQAPHMLAHYMDVLTTGALGNYRELLEEVTYSPAMAVYLTYLRNQKADPATGRVPDENYARELLQLFSVGLVELNANGTPVTNGSGEQIELFTNDDITELAKVFTGLSFSGAPFRAPVRALPLTAFSSPLATFDDFHSTESKQFLGITIPENTGARDSISMALDAIFAHPNLGPFIGRQLIQRFVTSSPQPAYVARVAAAFDAGQYQLPSGAQVGDGRRGDLKATIAAVLFDPRARNEAPRSETTFGKLREPVLRFTHWARAFEINSANSFNERVLRDTSSSLSLGQQPYRSPSVFNFYRPGYIAPGTLTGDAGLTAPELQITNASSIVGYPNFMTLFALEQSPKLSNRLPATFVPDYSEEIALAQDVGALIDHLDIKLTHGTLQADSRERITNIISVLDGSSENGRQLRVQVASVLIMTAPEYIVLR